MYGTCVADTISSDKKIDDDKKRKSTVTSCKGTHYSNATGYDENTTKILYIFYIEVYPVQSPSICAL